MHASHELAAPTPDRGTRGGKVVAVTLALLVMALATLGIATNPPKANAADVIATMTGTCDSTGKAVFSVSMPNPKTGAYNFEYRLVYTPSGGSPAQTGEATLAAGATFTKTFEPVVHSNRATWRVNFYDKDSALALTGESNRMNPCTGSTTTTTTTTTTSGTTTTTTTTTTSSKATSTTTKPTTSTTTNATTSTTATTGGTSPTSTTTTTGAVAPAASSSTGGGLAKTGVAVLVLLGAGAVLLFNGIGLARMTRRGWATKDDD